MTTVCLNMIVKNESNVIERMFDSVIGFIDTYCICDTGSTDDTIEKIRMYFDAKNISGKILQEEFKNFEYNRNFALEHAKDMADYILLMDADMTLVYDTKTDKKELLKEKAYYIMQGCDSFQYHNLRLVHNDVSIKCVGYTHEYYHVDAEVKKCDALFIQDIGDGGCKSNKWERDIKLLKSSIDENKEVCRSHFYLGNTYKDVGRYNDAIECYEYVLDKQTWVEERFIACLYMGECFRELGEYERAIAIWLNGYNICPNRAETLYEIIKFYRINGNHELCLLFYNWARSIKYPKDSVLFIKNDVYDYLLKNELVICGYYLLNRYPMLFYEILAIIKELLLNNAFTYRANLLDNYYFYKRYTTLEGMEQVYSIRSDEPGYHNSSPSIVKWLGDTYLLNVRMVNYTIAEDGSYHGLDDDGKIKTKNIAYILNSRFDKISEHIFSNTDDSDTKRIYGIEDVRLANIGGNIYYTGTAEDPSTGRLMISHNKYNINENLGINLIQHKDNNYCEKNWVMFDDNSKVGIIYSWYPLTIGDVRENVFHERQQIEMPEFFRYIRGSTNGILIDESLCFITHLVTMHNNKRLYYHCFVMLDKETFNVKDISLPFTFTNNNNIEYCLGLLKQDDDLIITYSLNDNCSKILKVPIVEFKKRVFLN